MPYNKKQESDRNLGRWAFKVVNMKVSIMSLKGVILYLEFNIFVLKPNFVKFSEIYCW